jgi:hypothetical protein
MREPEMRRQAGLVLVRGGRLVRHDRDERRAKAGPDRPDVKIDDMAVAIPLDRGDDVALDGVRRLLVEQGEATIAIAEVSASAMTWR